MKAHLRLGCVAALLFAACAPMYAQSEAVEATQQEFGKTYLARVDFGTSDVLAYQEHARELAHESQQDLSLREEAKLTEEVSRTQPFVSPAPATAGKRSKLYGSNRTFWMLAAAGAALTVIDFEMTQHNLRMHPNGRELNPLFGARPSRARMYGIGVPLTVSAQIFGWYARRRTKAWIAPQLSVIAGHTVGIISNTR